MERRNVQEKCDIAPALHFYVVDEGKVYRKFGGCLPSRSPGNVGFLQNYVGDCKDKRKAKGISQQN